MRQPWPNLLNQATQLHQQGQLEKAKTAYLQVLRQMPKQPDALYYLGVLHYQQGQLDQAIEKIRKSLKFRPDHTEGYHSLGCILKMAGQYDEALVCLAQAIQLKPDYAEGLFNLASTYAEMKMWSEAKSYFEKLLQVAPQYPGGWQNFGIVCFELNLFDLSEQAFQEAEKVDPHNGQLYFNWGNLLSAQQHMTEAIQCFEKSLSLGYEQARFNYACALLKAGRFEEGFRQYEVRLNRTQVIDYKRLKRDSLWQGQKAEGKRILVISEQGLGDTIQFSRYIPLVQAQGATVLWAVPDSLRSWLEISFPAVQFLPLSQAVLEQVEYDYFIPVMSLPRAFPSDESHLVPTVPWQVSPEKEEFWRDKLLEMSTHPIKVGLVWTGNLQSGGDLLRSCPAEFFAAFTAVEEVQFVNLQFGETEGQLKPYFAECPERLLSVMASVQDYSDTAAILKNLDLLISVDTSIVHAAGVLDVPVWTLLPFTSEWRWLTERDTSPWYEQLRLYRQTKPNDWTGLLTRVTKDLSKWRDKKQVK